MTKTKFTKIFFSLFCLIVSAILLGTSTYAWFSMNDHVTVTGMQVSAKASRGYMFIYHDSNSAGNITNKIVRDNNKTTEDVSGKYTSWAIDPVAHETITNISNANILTNWYTCVGKDYIDGTAKDNTKESITKFDGYVLYYDFYLAVANNLQDIKDVKVSKCEIALKNTTDTKEDLVKSVKVIVATDAIYEEFDSTVTSGTVILFSLLNHEDADSDVCTNHIRVYVYIDGNQDTYIKSSNKDNLKDVTINLEFAGDYVE